MIPRSTVWATVVAGKIDVGALAGLAALTVERSGGRLLTSAVELKILSPSGTFATTRGYIQRNRTVVERLTRSFVEAIHFLKTNRAGSITLLQKYFGGLSARPIRRSRPSPRRTSRTRVFLERLKRAA